LKAFTPGEEIKREQLKVGKAGLPPLSLSPFQPHHPSAVNIIQIIL
jgi:hypothetical protein